MNLYKKTLGFCISLIMLNTGIAYSQGTWSAVGHGLNAQSVAMTDYNGYLYIGKLNFSQPDEINKWDGAILSNVGGGTNGPVGALLVFNNELYVGGGFTAAGSSAASDVAKWDGNKWTPVGSQLDNLSILALAVYKGELYAAGYGVDATTTKASSFTIAKWDGTNWVGVGGGIHGGDVYCLTVYNNELYASGSFTKAGSVSASHIAKWDGISWSAVGKGSTTGSVIYTVNAYGGELYAGGDFSSIGGIPTNCLAKWNGTSWSKVGTTGNGTDNTVIALTEYKGDLYIGGAFGTVGGIVANHIVKWNGSSWSSLGNGVGTSNNPNEQVWCITPYQNAIYAAGTFATTNGITVNNIAKWTDQANGVEKIIKDTQYLHVYPNPFSKYSRVEFYSATKTTASISIFDLLGNNISTLYTGEMESGLHQYSLADAKKFHPGIYIVRVITKSEIFTEKLIVN